jgi:outer membrane protein OmpA-like peptidoglycan-associated protein
VTYGVGVGKQWHDWSASAELVGSAPLPVAGIPGAWPVEALVSLGVPSGRLRLGVGRGLTRGFGAPAWRVALAMTASTGTAQDSDLDGIVDPRDLCRNKPEDRDHYRDEDGCPEPDNDSDGFIDAEDDCPNNAEVYNGLRDDDGCPDETSVLRVRVVSDRGELEQVLVEVDGEDNALIGGEELNAEVFPGPHSLRVSSEGYRPVTLRVDLESGGTLVEVMLEQLVFGELRVILVGPEQGTLEVEGAELSISGERVVELPAGPQLVRVQADGWAPAHTVVQVPEDGQVTVTLAPNRLALDLEGSEVVLAEDVHFELDSCEVIPGEGLEVLAYWLVDTPSVSLLRVEGHADELGGPAYNYALSLCRADAVVAWLVEQGVEEQRLLAVGAGEALAAGPESRRVGFLVLIWNEAVVVEEPPVSVPR